MHKKVIVIGYTGQDGSLLVDELIKRGDHILGISSSKCFLHGCHYEEKSININDEDQVNKCLKIFKPDEVYYLAAKHDSSEFFDQTKTMYRNFLSFQEINVNGLVNFLTAIVRICPKTKLFYASSSLVFGEVESETQTEITTFNPKEFYAITKVQGMNLCKMFREKYNVFASTGILYNHESHLRKQNFLTSKIINTAYKISKGSNEKLEIGNMSALVDWGYARDFVSAFQKILSLKKADDFIVSTGELHSVKEFVEIVFKYFKLNYSNHVIENNNILSRISVVRRGDYTKLKNQTGWKPSYVYKDFVVRLINDHISYLNVSRLS